MNSLTTLVASMWENGMTLPCYRSLDCSQIYRDQYWHNSLPLCIYGDPACPSSIHLQAPFSRQNLKPNPINCKAMSQTRVSVECLFNQEFGRRWMSKERKSIWTVRVINGCDGLEYWNFGFWGMVKIFLISVGVSYEGGIIFYVHFPILKCKISKFREILLAAPSFSIFTFSDLRYMQGFK